VRAGFQGGGQPGLDVGGEGRGCNVLSGKCAETGGGGRAAQGHFRGEACAEVRAGGASVDSGRATLMKWATLIVAIIVDGTVAVFGIYTFGWRDDREAVAPLDTGQPKPRAWSFAISPSLTQPALDGDGVTLPSWRETDVEAFQSTTPLPLLLHTVATAGAREARGAQAISCTTDWEFERREGIPHAAIGASA